MTGSIMTNVKQVISSFKIVLPLCSALLAGCQSIGGTADYAVIARKPVIPEGQVQVYIFKEIQFVGSGVDWALSVDGEHIYDYVDSSNYAIVNLWPGTHKISLYGISRGDGGKWNTRGLIVEPDQVGERLFLEIDVGEYLGMDFYSESDAANELVGRQLEGEVKSYSSAKLDSNIDVGSADIIGPALIQSNLLHGRGEIRFSEYGAVLEGQFDNGNLVELYSYTDKQGNAFSGTLNAESLAPESGILTYKNGDTFEGKFNRYSYQPDGQGICTREGVTRACVMEKGNDITDRVLNDQKHPGERSARYIMDSAQSYKSDISQAGEKCLAERRNLIKYRNTQRGTASGAQDHFDAYFDRLDKLNKYKVGKEKFTEKANQFINQANNQNKDWVTESTLKYISSIPSSVDAAYRRQLKSCQEGVKTIMAEIGQNVQDTQWSQAQLAKRWPEQPKEDIALTLLKQQQSMLADTQSQLNKQRIVTTSTKEVDTVPKATKTTNLVNKVPVSSVTSVKTISQDTTSKNSASSTTKSKREKVVEMEISKEAIAYCAEFVSGGWKCNGPIQNLLVKVDTVDEGLNDVGCVNARRQVSYIPEGGDPKTQGAVYFCGYGLWSSDRDITKSMTIPSSLLSARKEYSCPRTELKRCKVEM